VTAENKSSTTLVLSLLAVAISGASAYFSYRSARAAEQNAALQASQIETRLRLVAMLNPTADRPPALVVKLANEGAPVAIENVGFELAVADGQAYYACWRPKSLEGKLPLRLERNASLDLTLGPNDIRSLSKRDRLRVRGIMAATASGRVFRFNDEAVQTYLRDAQ
jgi:hypothetical protein